MQVEDILWRVLDRLGENKQVLNEIIDELDPEKQKEVVDALMEVALLTEAQINICRRLERRIQR